MLASAVTPTNENQDIIYYHWRIQSRIEIASEWCPGLLT
jgi:hypothetical protein